ncbi:MAG: uracil-DNA glycosylase [Desulfuromonadia bacterium]
MTSGFSLRDHLVAYLEELKESGVDHLPLTITTEGGEGADPETLESIRLDLGDCHRCPLGDLRTNLVFGIGTPHPRLVFVGEAPGRDEDLKGEPFVGAAGQLLTRIIAAMGLSRDQVYICNVLKCRPPQNRDPHLDEIETCSPFLVRQLRTLSPEVIVALGRIAAHTLLSTQTPIGRLRGNFHQWEGIPVMPTYHPSALLRDESLKRPVWEDMKKVMERLGLPIPARG